MVPTFIQVKIRTHFNPEQCKPGNGVRPSIEWFAAAREAREYIAKLEKEKREETKRTL